MDKKFQPKRNFLSYRSSNFGLGNLARDVPLPKICNEDYKCQNRSEEYNLEAQEDNLKLGREFFLYKQQLMRDPTNKLFPKRLETDSDNNRVLKAPGSGVHH